MFSNVKRPLFLSDVSGQDVAFNSQQLWVAPGTQIIFFLFSRGFCPSQVCQVPTGTKESF